jgi:predicted nucleic acid-binding protein
MGVDPEASCFEEQGEATATHVLERLYGPGRPNLEQILMVILDTSVWIEFLRGNEPYWEAVSDLLDRNEVLALSPVFGELLQGARNKRERSLIHEFWEALPKADEQDLFIRAGAESGRSKWIDKGVGLIDAAILMASRETSSFVWTLDKNLDRILSREDGYKPRI